MSEELVPLPPLTDSLYRVIAEPWRRRPIGVRLERNTPRIIDPRERALLLQQGASDE